jgi:hypothetical protein
MNLVAFDSEREFGGGMTDAEEEKSDEQVDVIEDRRAWSRFKKSEK